MSPIKVGDKVWWLGGSDMYEVVLAVTNEHAFMVWLDGGTSDVVRRVPLSELTLVESAPMTAPVEPDNVSIDTIKSMGLHEWESARTENERLKAEVERLREEQVRLASLSASRVKDRDQAIAVGLGYREENARLREALQMAVDTIAHNGPDGVSMAAALGIRPSIRHKETP